MNQSIFDAKEFIQFDLPRGRIQSLEKERLTLVPTEMLSFLDSESLKNSAEKWGNTHGARLAKTMTQSSTIEILAGQITGTLATMGFGEVELSIRGDALCFLIEKGNDTQKHDPARAILSGFLAGYLRAVSKENFKVIWLGKDNNRDVFLACNEKAEKIALKLKNDGISPLATIDSLSKEEN